MLFTPAATGDSNPREQQQQQQQLLTDKVPAACPGPCMWRRVGSCALRRIPAIPTRIPERRRLRRSTRCASGPRSQSPSRSGP